jgi:hypothetical protein
MIAELIATAQRDDEVLSGGWATDITRGRFGFTGFDPAESPALPGCRR